MKNQNIQVIEEGHAYQYRTDNEGNFFVGFQKGTVPELGANGWTNEAMLEVLIDRITWLNTAFACRENSIVITKLEEALMWLEKRTADREARGVEGKHVA